MNPSGRRSGGHNRLDVIAIGVVVLGLAVGLWSLAPPAAADRNAPPAEFSAERAFDHVAAIAGEPHPMGSAANAAVRAYLVAELERLGVATQLQEFIVPDYFGGGGMVDVVNVIGLLPGRASTGSIVLMAHYDTDPKTPGANDNTSAVAALLEAGRALAATAPGSNDVVFLFTDGEEPAPRYGAKEFLASSPLVDEIGLVVNFEALGGSGPSLLVETNGPVVAELGKAAGARAAFSFLPETVELMGEIGTDFAPFKSAGIPGAHFAYVRGSPIYHTEADSIDNVSLASLQHHGTHALAIARHFGNIDLRAMDDPGQLAFYSLGPLAVQHPAMVGLVAAVGALLLALALAIRRRQAQTALLRTWTRWVLGGLAAAVMGTAAWWLIAELRPTVGLAEGYVYLVGLIGAVGAVGTRIARIDQPGGRFGVVVTWALLGLATALVLPGFSYLFAIPALAAAGALAWRRPRSPAEGLARFGLATLPAVMLTVPAIDVFWQMAQPRPGNPDSELTAAAALPILVGGLVAALVRCFWPGERESVRSDSGGASITNP